MFHFCVTAEALPLLLKNNINATIWSEILQYGLTYTMQTWSHIYDAMRCEPSDVSGYLIRTSGCLIWHDLTTLIHTCITQTRLLNETRIETTLPIEYYKRNGLTCFPSFVILDNSFYFDWSIYLSTLYICSTFLSIHRHVEHNL